MDYKRDYFQEENEFWNSVHEEDVRRKEGLTEEALAAEEEQIHIEADELLRKIKEKQKGIYNIVDPEKAEQFQRMVSVADELAQLQPLDIHAWSTAKYGRIKLSGENLIITYNTPREPRLGIGQLFYYAEDAFVSAKGNKLEIEFSFPFCVKS